MIHSMPLIHPRFYVWPEYQGFRSPSSLPGMQCLSNREGHADSPLDGQRNLHLLCINMYVITVYSYMSHYREAGILSEIIRADLEKRAEHQNSDTTSAKEE
jgi:hypothetical protein